MLKALKKPYKITLWEDKNIYIVNKEKKGQLENSDEVQNQYLEEVCVATIGSDTMDTPIRVFNPILTEELNGSRTLTFQIYYRYWDDDSEDFKLNPFINLLVNERKVKLKYNDEWYDFVIKQVQEDSESKVFTYTCSDLFINELGKTGYEVELDTELQNNMGTIQELSAIILEGTDWSEKDSDHLIQRNKELLYSYILPNAIQATDMKSNETVTISAGEVIYVFYSCKVRNEVPIQFLYVPSNGESTYDEALLRYKIDKDGFITNSKNWQTSNSINYNNLRHSSYFGEKIVEKQKSKFIPKIGETCTVWGKYNEIEEPSGNPKNQEWYELINENYILTEDTTVQSGKNYYRYEQYYCYTESEYASVAEIQNMLVNGANFITINGWSGNVTLSTYTNNSTTYRTISVNGTVKNNGFFANRAALAPKGFVKGSSYTFAIKAGGTNNISSAQVRVKDNGGTETTILNFSSGTMVNSGVLSGYKKFTATCNTSISYQSLVNDYLDIIFKLTANSSTEVIDAKVFLNRYDSNGDLIVPDLQSLDTQGNTNSIVNTRYNFFPVNTDFSTVYGKDSLTLSQTFLEDEKDNQQNTLLSYYTPVMIEGYGKVTSITGSKSNRFNLIQSLCEVFECWAKFSIEHDENTGKILYDYIPLPQDEYVEGGRYYTKVTGATDDSTDDNNFEIWKPQEGEGWRNNLYKKVYHKYVTFKEFIGQDNIVGFKYGINLKSIQRDVVSDQIASKVIVQPNTNEFAPNGSCTIQQAVLNPTGENALYNFQYFVNHGLLDATALYDDLYGENGGLGFYPNMRALNDSIVKPIQELALLSNTITTLESRQTVYNALLEEADNLKANISAELNANGYGINGGNNVPDYISNLRKNYKSYDTTAGYYTSVSASNNSLLNTYRSQYEALSSQLKGVLAKKNKLNSDFHNKYYKFIQEGTWTSNDYYDPELYYQAANMVLYTSSFPQTSYTINVLELSQLEGYEPYTFKIADKTYIEDTEFFGYDYKNRPYKEEIVVSEVKYSLDDPAQNTITVQNYKTQFQDLFQRIAATSQSLQYNEGAYNRAANAITSNGEIQPALLQNSLKDNELIIQNAKNQSVTWDETGITISNFVNANELVRLTSGGIVLSVDGGQTWTTGITGTGINADVITTGRLDTSRIRIFNSQGNQTFEWNEKGINAFAWNTTSGHVDYSKLVRFDQYGLYGYIGDVGWDPTTAVDGDNVVGVNKVIRDSIFSLTWKGLSINLPNGQSDSVITIGSAQNPTFKIDGSGNITMAGNINLAGNITWAEDNQPFTAQKLYCATNSSTPNRAYENYGNYNNAIVKVTKYNASGINTSCGWELAPSDINPEQNLYDMYQSTNMNINSSYSVATIDFTGYTTFTIYIRSYAEANDYTIASLLNPTGVPTSTTSDNTKQHTYNNQNGGTALANYTRVDYTDLNQNSNYKIYIVFRKSESGKSNDDRGYFLIPKTQPVWHKFYNKNFDNYISYSFDSGQTWNPPEVIKLDSQNVYDALIKNESGQLGIFYTKDNHLCINADYIKAGSITADRIHGGTLSGVSLNINNRFHVDSDGNLWLGNVDNYDNATTFKVSNSGTLNCTGATITGTLKASSLQIKRNGKFTNILTAIDDSNDSLSGSYIDAKGISVSNSSGTTTFNVSSSGTVTVRGTIYANNIYSMSDSSNYINISSSGITVYTSGSVKAILGGPNPSYSNSMMIKLGNTSPLYVEKVYTGGRNQAWIGNGSFSCGIAFNFDSDPPTYQIKGTAGTVSW